VFIGLVSYSLYLWHWPALVFTRLYLNRELATVEAVGVLLAAFAASVLSWRFVEQPIRSRRGLWRGMRASLPLAALGAATFAAVAALLLIAGGLPQRMPADVRAVAAEAAAPRSGAWCSPGDTSGLCRHGGFAAEAVLWGDSHARALAPGLLSFVEARHMSLRQYTRSACPPVPELAVLNRKGGDFPECAAFNRDVLAAILRSRPRLVVLEARWEAYFNAARIQPAADADAIFSTALTHLLDTLGAHRIAVLVVGNVPVFADVPAHCYGHERVQGRNPSRCFSEPWSTGVDLLVQSERLLFRAVVPRTAFARYHPAFADLCDARGCHAFWAGHVLYIDDHHLSPFGATLVGQRLDAALRNWPP
jgi:hypothetical protein